MVIPWWGKICLKILLSRLPLTYVLWRKLGLFRHGKMDQISYVQGVFQTHCKQAGFQGNLNGRVILELGPGDSISTVVMAASYGARALLVDTGFYASTDLKLLVSIAEHLKQLGLSPPDLSAARSIDEVLISCGGAYKTEGLSSLREIRSESVDFIFSHAVLEHVREHEFLDTMNECRRILKRHGLASHRVDLKDHLGGGLNNLRFSKKIWESKFFVCSGFYTNRIRYSRMINLMTQAGFEVCTSRVSRWDSLPISRDSLSAESSQESEEDLLINGFDVVLKLPPV